MIFSPDIHYHPSLPSTMDEARRLADAGALEGTVVQSGIQTAGRGRFGNNWVSPEGNLYMTLVLRPPVDTRVCAQLSFVCALGLADTLQGCGITDIALKWPNDVLLGGKKIAGILLEMQGGANGHPDYMLVGMGVNIAHAPEGRAYIKDFNDEATVGAVRDALLASIARYYADWLGDGFAGIREAWLRQAYGIGQKAIARMADRRVEGVFEAIDAEGNIVLREADGQMRVVHGAEVHFGEA